MRKVQQILWAGVSLVTLTVPAMAQTGQIINETPPPGTELPTSEPEGADVADDTGELAPTNEIVVSARRRAESVQDVPQTVNVVTAAQVEKLNLRNFTEIASVVPGLQLQSQNSFTNTASVRGITFDPRASGNSPSVEFYLNDAPISSSFLFQSTFDFGQFELQRGPQGTLRGRASPSGSIAVTTRRPDLDEVGAVFNGTITDLHARKVDGAFNIPIIADVLAVRVAGVIDNNRGDRVRSLSEAAFPQFSEGPYSRTKSIRGSVRFEPTDWAQFNFMAQQLHNVRHGYDQIASESLLNPTPAIATPVTIAPPIIGPFDRLGHDEQGSFNRQDQQVYIGNADFQFAGQRLSYVGTYNKQDFGVLASQDSGNFFAVPRITALTARAPGDPAGTTFAGTTIVAGGAGGFDAVCGNDARRQGANLTNGAYDQCTHSIARRQSHELRLASEERIGGIFDYVVGAFYDHNSNPSNLTQETAILSSLAVLTTPTAVAPTLLTVSRTALLRRGKSTEKSAFANLTAHLLDDRLEIAGGVRFIDYKSTQLPLLQGSATGVQNCAELDVRCNALGPNPAATATTDKFHPTIYTGSVKYKISRDVMVYALTGSSWRPGLRVTGDFNAAPTPLELSFVNLDPERSKAYEIGAKTSFLDGRGRFNISAYHQKFKNYPLRSNAGVFFVNTQTVGGLPNVSSFNFVSAVPVRVKGVEAEASYQILERWSLGVNASYADGKVRNGVIACNDLDRNGIPDINPATPTLGTLQTAVGAGQTISACQVSRRASESPKFSANVQSEFGFDVGASTDAFVRGLYTFAGKTVNDPDNALDNVGSYGLLNLYAGIRDKDGAWELTVFGKNVTREREILTVGNTLASTGIRTAAATGTFLAPYRTVSITAPREFGLTAKIALGSK